MHRLTLMMAALCAFWTTLPLVAQTSPPTDKAFERKLEGIEEALYRNLDIAEALKRLDKAVAAARGKPALKQNRERIIRIVKDAKAFELTPLPSFSGLIQGKLKKWNDKKNEIDVSYKRNQFKDWIGTTDRKADAHRGEFIGDCRIEFSGKKYPKNTQVSFAVASMDDRGVSIRCGSQPGDNGRYFKTELAQFKGENNRILDHASTSPFKAGKPWKVQVTIKKKRISVKANGKSLFKAKMPKGYDAGSIVFSRTAKFDSCRIRGTVVRALNRWPIRIAFIAAEDDRKKFAAKYDAREHLPAWFFDDAPKKEDS